MASMPPRQHGPLDIHLLHSKLETHRRQQEASARASRERKSSTPKKNHYFPRNAASHFSITTTPAAAQTLRNPAELQRRASLPVIPTIKQDDLTALNLETIPTEAKMESGLEQIDSTQTSPMDTPTGISPAKRQTTIGFPPQSSNPPLRKPMRPSSFHPGMSSQFHPLQNCRPSPSQEISSSRRKSEATPSTTDQSQRKSIVLQRPPINPAIYNRPDWAQQSQNGEESSSLPHLLPRVMTGVHPAERRKLPHELQQQQHPTKKQEHHHLVADAVRIIQEQQRTNRKKSLLGFFKKR